MGLGGPGDTPPHPKHATSIMTQALPLPPLEVLQKKFDYDPETGTLTRRSTGKTVGYPTERGWLRVKVGNTHYRVHRIVWKMQYGEDPPVGLDIDHINRNKVDNRISNLRVVTRKENLANSARVKAIVITLPSGEEKWYSSMSEAARAEQINQGHLYSVASGKMKQTKGFTARYADL